MNKVKNTLIMAALLIVPLLAGRAYAQVIDAEGGFPCDGYEIGSFCLAVTDDPTTCQDCAGPQCDGSCAIEGPEAWRYCYDVSFTACIGGLVVQPFWTTYWGGATC